MPDHMEKPLDDLAIEVLEDGIIDAEEVNKIKERIYGDDIIDREEADFLFRLNDSVSGASNDPGWKNLFVEALTDHVTKDKQSPGMVDEEEAAYLISKIEGDGKVDEVELALLVNIAATAKECHASLNVFTLGSMKNSILEDGIIDDAEVEMIRNVIFGTGGGAGEQVDRAEADFLFALNNATSGNKNSPAWKSLFVDALTKHVLEDDVSPGVVDEEEADWIIGRIEGDGVYDDNEKALLKSIKENARQVHRKLEFKMDMQGV